MIRPRKGLAPRKSQYRDPKTLFVVATEGTVTEPVYFEAIKQHVLQHPSLNRLVEIQTLSRLDEGDTRSDPADILALLDGFKRAFSVEADDELWLLVDRDHRFSNVEKEKMARIQQLCAQKGYEFCLTTPCIELWLLLHLKDLNDYAPDEQKALLDNKKSGRKNSRTRLEQELLHLLGAETGYNKSNPNMAVFLPLIPDAIARAVALNLHDGWAYDRFCTRAHVLVGRILGGDNS